MLKYVKDIQEDGKCLQVGNGSNSKFYESIGMVQKDIEKSEIDNQWYLADKCPHYTEEELAQQAEKQQVDTETAELESNLSELKSMYLQAQMVGDTETMETISAYAKDLLGVTETTETETTDTSTTETVNGE